ncbi:MAG TPA: DUF1552 domain-containing protein [Polyangiaceae bacterium]|nr:DUF1552 domain-containing protein [Polyangiaceae bacterium]
MARSRFVIPRRTFLRGTLAGGIGLALPLPRLAGMLNGNGTAYADGEALPQRFGTWFFGNGIIPDRWVPRLTGSGDAWELSEQLAPLQHVKPWLSVLTGFSIKIPNNAPHASMPAAALTGAQVGSPVRLPSIDQLIAPVISEGAAFPTGLHVGVSNVSGATTLGLNISFRGSDAPNPPEYSPAALFQNLLGFTSNGSTTPKAPDPELLSRSRVLDAVSEDVSTLRARLGVEDQQRLDLHLDGIAELQGQIAKQQMPAVTGTITDPDEAYPDRGNDGSISRQRSQAFADLLVFAMASDLTRVFSYMFTCPACHGNYADCGLEPSTFHEDYGHRLSPQGLSEATKGFNTGVKFAMSNLGDLLGRMAQTPDGAGTLLDNSCVYVTSCVSESQTHGGTDYPLLVAGKAGGVLKGDQHIRLLDENVSKVPYTLLTALGGTDASFGEDEGLVTSGVPELLA